MIDKSQFGDQEHSWEQMCYLRELRAPLPTSQSQLSEHLLLKHCTVGQKLKSKAHLGHKS